MKQRVAYQGSVFTIEWYYDEKGSASALEFFQRQPMNKQRKILNLFRLMGDHGKIFDETKFRNEEDKIYAFKPHPDRYLCFFFEGRRIVVTNAFTKKSQKLPYGEKEQAVKAFRSYQTRIKLGSYYEEKN